MVTILVIMLLLTSGSLTLGLLDFSSRVELPLTDRRCFELKRCLARLLLLLRGLDGIALMLNKLVFGAHLAILTFPSCTLSTNLLLSDLVLTILLELKTGHLSQFFVPHACLKLLTLTTSLTLLLLHGLDVTLKSIDAVFECLHVLLLLFNVILLPKHD